MARKLGKKRYELYDAFRTKSLAKKYAADFRRTFKCGARVIDKKTGILRYELWVPTTCKT